MRTFCVLVTSCCLVVASTACGEEAESWSPPLGNVLNSKATSGRVTTSPDYYAGANCDSSCDGLTVCPCANLASCCDCTCEQWYLFPQCDHGVNFRGWIDGGYVWNNWAPTSKFNGPYNAVDRSNEPMLNQLYFIAEKELPCCGAGMGARLDTLYGEDFFLAESIGLEKRADGSARWNNEYYGLAFPQAYVNFGNQDLSLQVGHFYSIVGYEGLMSPDNFFYSKSYSYQFAGPFTHWGGQVNWNMTDALSIQVGLHNGWDALDRVEDSVGFIGKAKYEFDNGAWTSFAITTGDEYNNAAGLAIPAGYTNRTRYSSILSLPLTCQMDYVVHGWAGFQQQGSPNGGRADWYGIDQYLYYTINDCWRTGMRFEWFRDEDGTRVGLNRPSNPNKPPLPGNYFSLAYGVNWSPTSNIMVRPEMRMDWYNGTSATLPYNDGLKDKQFMLGVDAVLKF